LAGQRPELRKLVGDVPQGAVLEPNLALRGQEEQAAKPLPLDLEEVLVVAERDLGRRGLHRPDGGGKPADHDRELVRAGGHLRRRLPWSEPCTSGTSSSISWWRAGCGSTAALSSAWSRRSSGSATGRRTSET